MPLTLDEAERALADLRRLPYGTARTAAAESLTRDIETAGPASKLPEALLDLIEAYTFSNEGLRSFVAFARLLRLLDENPDLFDSADTRNVYWEYKWVAADLPAFPEITAAQAEAFLEDMERRFALAGLGTRSVAMSAFRWAWNAGLPTADQALDAWLATPRDEYEDCAACTVGHQVDFFASTGRPTEALHRGVGQHGTCNLEPTRTLHALAVAHLDTGDATAALATYRAALAAFDDTDSDFAACRGQGFQVLARTGQITRALADLKGDYQGLLTSASSPLGRLRFLIGVLAGLSANLDQPDLPTRFDVEGMSDLQGLHTWVHWEANDLARDFDTRVDGTFYADQIAQALTARRVAALTEPEADAGLTAPAQSAGAVVDERPASSAPLPAAGTTAVAATADHAELARIAEEGGFLAEAGRHWAELAHEAQLTGDDAAAHRSFATAVPRLLAGDAAPALTARVIVAWAPTAARLDETDEILSQLDSALVGTVEATDPEVVRARADLLDTRARILASTRPELHTDIVSAASEAAELYARTGRIGDAAHSFWLAGRVQRDRGATTDAIWSLESAIEGFQHSRDRERRALVAGELIELFRATGQADRADALTATLLG